MNGVSLRSNSHLIFENNFGTFDFSLDQRYKVHNVLKKYRKVSFLSLQTENMHRMPSYFASISAKN